MKKDKKPWAPTVEQIRSMIMASRQGYGLTRATTIDQDTMQERFILMVWKDGNEEFRFEDDSEKGCFYQAYSEMVRKGKIKP